MIKLMQEEAKKEDVDIKQDTSDLNMFTKDNINKYFEEQENKKDLLQEYY